MVYKELIMSCSVIPEFQDQNELLNIFYLHASFFI